MDSFRRRKVPVKGAISARPTLLSLVEGLAAARQQFASIVQVIRLGGKAIQKDHQERAQGWLCLPNGKALTGFSHDYKRHGTTTLFAALEVATGLVKAGHYQRRRRVEFLDFMNGICSAYPQQQIHVILDNLNTHKPKHHRWLQRHKHVHFHYIPTHASWLNQIEIWFSILSRQALAAASFHSVPQLCRNIDDFLAAYNQTAHPFEWKKQVVFQKHPKIIR